ncbi:hypothetical protein FQR65_LT17732 [Abscondita terminalis]|nr:hypothetical protein FQR65_LT17732 [Abscondita terminalis]
MTVGKGGYPDRDGNVTLDACIMDSEGNCGSVAALEHIAHPISVARLVNRKRTAHVMLNTDGVKSVLPGYMGGKNDHPTYEQVCTGTTDHVEVVHWILMNQKDVPDPKAYAQLMIVTSHPENQRLLWVCIAERSRNGKMENKRKPQLYPNNWETYLPIHPEQREKITASEKAFYFLVGTEESAECAGQQTEGDHEEVTVQNNNEIKVVLQEDNQLLNEVVVTALGVSREKRTLGYSVTQINGETLTQARENNVANSLVGEGSRSDVTATAEVSDQLPVWLSGGVQSEPDQPALYVIQWCADENAPSGIVNANPNGNKGSQWDNAPDMGDAIGAAASALYGSRAKAGVILITTKSGKGYGIDFSSNYVVEQVMDRTDWQYVYGQGTDVRTTDEKASTEADPAGEQS